MKPPFRRNLLPANIAFICQYWGYPYIIEDYRIGESFRIVQISFRIAQTVAKEAVK